MDATGTIRLGGSEIIYKVERKRVRNSYLRFSNGELQIVVPEFSFTNADKLIREHADWIIRQYERSKRIIRLFDENSNKMLYMGREYYITFSYSKRSAVDVLPDVINVKATNVGSAEAAIEKFIRSETYRIATEKANEMVKQIGEEVKGIKVRRSKKWGSCSSNHIIVFNAYLSMLPQEVSNYVIAHEVAHLKEMNHSKAFWRVVNLLYPNYKQARRNLRYYDNTRRKIIAL